jgi:ankyrin repeat protein
VDAGDIHGNRPLHIAAMRGNHTAVELLIGAKADFAAVSGRGFTPLQYAREARSALTVQVLVDAKASV